MSDHATQRDFVARVVVDAAYVVHTTLGPGLLESVYEECLAVELASRGLLVARQTPVAVVYRGVRIDAGFRMDLVVDEAVVVEIKAVELMRAVHKAQLLTYLKLSGHKLGLLINFNVPRIKDGISRLRVDF